MRDVRQDMPAHGAGTPSKDRLASPVLLSSPRHQTGLLWQTIYALVRTVDAKDRYTGGHSVRVANYARMISERMGRSTEDCTAIYVAGLLHDVGKIGVPDAIITKKGRLTKEERDIIRLHPLTGYNILSPVTEMPEVAMVARWHHERYDGGGYPDGLAGDDIPEFARIVAVADSYDTMTSRRSYHEPRTQDVVRHEIASNAGTQFDPEVARVMLELIDEDRDYVLRETDSLVVLVLSDSSGAGGRMADVAAGIAHDVREHDIRPGHPEDWEGLGLAGVDVAVVDLDAESGVSVLREFARRFPGVPVVAVTSDNSFTAFREAIESGATNCLMRPLVGDVLQEAILNSHQAFFLHNAI